MRVIITKVGIQVPDVIMIISKKRVTKLVIVISRRRDTGRRHNFRVKEVL